MARRSTNRSEPEKVKLAPEQIPIFIRKIERRVSDLEKFDPRKVESRFDDPSLTALKAEIEGTLSDIFGHGSIEYNRYIEASDLDTAPLAPGVSPSEVRLGLSVGRDKAQRPQEHALVDRIPSEA